MIKIASARGGNAFFDCFLLCCADMAVQNVIGCSTRGATWVAIHNGGGVQDGEREREREREKGEYKQSEKGVGVCYKTCTQNA